MAKQSVLGHPSAMTHSPKTGFSMSQNFTFTCASGMLLPVYKEFLNIGEKVTGCPKAFVRTEPLLAPSMTDLDLYVDVFFVPMRHLYSMFDAWITQVDDLQSDLWDTTVWENHLPIVGKEITTVGEGKRKEAFGWCDYDFFNNVQIVDPSYQYKDGTNGSQFAMTFGFGAHRLAMHLGYNAQGYFANHDDVEAHSGQKSYATFDYDTFTPDSINPEFFASASNIHQAPFAPYYFQAYQKIYYDYYRDSEFEANEVRAYNLDDELNSGSTLFWPYTYDNPRTKMFQLRFRNKSKDYFTAIHANPMFNSIGMLPNAKQNLARAKNWLQERQPDAMSFDKSILLKDDVDVDLYADEELSTSNNGVYYAPDDPTLSVFNNLNIDEDLYGYNDSEDYPISHKHNVPLEYWIEEDKVGALGDLSGISLAQMRTAFAMDKLLRITNRAGKHVDDQMLAQFGVKIPQGVSGEVYKLKSYHTTFHIGEVIQNATTFDSNGDAVPLGEMAGRGVALLNSNEKFSFTAPCHGILMAILSISPRYKYCFAVEKDGLKTYIEDFFRPQYDNLGMQPTLKSEYGYDDDDIERVWQYRYMEDKIKFDKASMVFAVNSKNPWSFVKNPVLPSISSKQEVGQTWYKVNPWDTNSIFVTQWNGLAAAPRNRDKGLGDWSYGSYTHTPVEFLSNYLLDPFTVDFEMKNTLVSQMSTYGEPSLGGL